MFQRTLILAAISVAFASVNPPWLPILPCEKITSELQRALRPVDPHTFPIISDFNYIRDNERYSLDIFNLTFEGFSNVSCSYFNLDEPHLATLILAGPNLEFNTSRADVHLNTLYSPNQQNSELTLQAHVYTLELRFRRDYYSPYPFNLCITRDSLQVAFHAEGITASAWELNNHPEAVVDAINFHLPRFASDLATTLNNILCKSIDFSSSTAIPTTTPGNRTPASMPSPSITSTPRGERRRRGAVRYREEGGGVGGGGGEGDSFRCIAPGHDLRCEEVPRQPDTFSCYDRLGDHFNCTTFLERVALSCQEDGLIVISFICTIIPPRGKRENYHTLDTNIQI
ncbi:uncharacterized protein [Palaemon carinicauda]|uniref:uncharacterized protein n=1 Tax=Palaemon carinicauda TaxID=392227 RepID=UPI0035B5E506